MSILTQALRRLAETATGVCPPNSCLACGVDSNTTLCPDCESDLPFLPQARCPQCAEPNALAERCGRCLSKPPSFDATVALYRYDFPLDRLVQALKYRHQLSLAGWFGLRLSEALSDLSFDRVIAMPLHPQRLRSRGFNQSTEIGRAMCRRLGVRPDLFSLKRCRATESQADLSLAARADNVKGAFECDTDLAGQTVLLVDDVMTTGATASESARVLKVHGATHVTVAVVARALPHR